VNATTRKRRKAGGDMDALRAKDREYQRRRRAKLYAAGLTSDGAPVRFQAMSDAKRTNVEHPAACPCYDCLFGKPREYQPTVYRTGVAS